MHDKLKSKGVHSLLMSPGNVLSSITVAAVHPVVLLVVLYLMRFLGCSGINITGYNAAFAAEWLSINEFQSLDSKTVYHSEISRLGTSWTREIQVDVCQDDLKETEAVLNKMDQIIKSQS